MARRRAQGLRPTSPKPATTRGTDSASMNPMMKVPMTPMMGTVKSASGSSTAARSTRPVTSPKTKSISSDSTNPKAPYAI
ncbi:MAG: hypothetical protein VX427_04635 [Acidobacteriota bacterium]|nr:hypothetical protein [Acidobacteriota bacterium]